MKVQLKVVGGSKAGQVINVTLPQFIIGRAEDCHLKPRSELVSRYHCAILSEEGYAAVRDLGSKNGVFVNGKRIPIEQELKNGDHVLIGPLEFEIALSVGLKGQTKSKVESMQEVVARAAEQSSTPAGKQESKKHMQADEQKPGDSDDGISDWLLSEGEADGGETHTYEKAEGDDDPLYGLQKRDDEPVNDTETVLSKKQPAPQPGAANSSDAAANLLKNFFRTGR
ncbi:MAG: FHA domain-containing protein [Planctomycetia bacterium]|nr:FHA domain-containing protein [Planctomycetia bacterium]